MKRVLVALVAALLAAAADLTDDDPDSDPARFMMVVEHGDGYRCAASLVSVRAGVTTARCARPRGAGDMWALAASLVSARPPPPLAAAARRVTRVAFAGDGSDPADPALDIALLELEEPFGVEASSKPILMATSREACEAPLCHAVRALPALPAPPAPPGSVAPPVVGRRVRLRVVSLSRATEATCAARVPHWSSFRARCMCLTGDTLCERDLGGGVVCGGKLCGVLSAAVTTEGAGKPCGDTLAAQSVAHWRRFLHCAYTFHICGSGTCAGQCTERRLLDDHKDMSSTVVSAVTEAGDIKRLTATRSSFSWSDSIQVPSSEQPPQTPVREQVDRNIEPASVSPPFSFLPPSPFPPPLPSSPRPQYSRVNSLSWPSRTSPSRVTRPLAISLFDSSGESQPASLRPAAEFEPNRPDFKAATNQPTRVGLKAGEYGDNAADYGEEAAPPASSSPASAQPARAPPPHRTSPPVAPLELAAAPVPAARALHASVTNVSSTSGSIQASTSSLLECAVIGFLRYYNRNKKV